MTSREKLKLEAISLKGYKSINNKSQTIRFHREITILLGANGSGKSNLVSFFTMLNYMMGGALQIYIGQNGFANSLLYRGSKQTTRIEASIVFRNSKMEDTYSFILSHAAGDTLIFNEETMSFKNHKNGTGRRRTLDPGLKESGLSEKVKKDGMLKVIYFLLRNCRVFQFHDTSKDSQIRSKSYIDGKNFLRNNGSNLASFLYLLKNEYPKYYDRIVRYVQQMMPQFRDFELRPEVYNNSYVSLDWKEKNSNYDFGSHQISDGSLRFMCLAALLLQPPDLLPEIIILDEPELGLHPSAIAIFAGMVRTASQNSQVIMATQSPRLVDEFEAENIVIVERDSIEDCTNFKTLDSEKLNEWLERYSLSELWEKNVLGGRP